VKKSLGATAHHEAGHAVAAWRLEIPFRYATIIPHEDSLGHVLFNRFPKWCDEESERYQPGRARLWVERRVRVYCAGQIAEAMYHGRRPIVIRTHRMTRTPLS